MRLYISICFLLFSLITFSQKKEIDFNQLDSLYREDQFYINFSNNNLQKSPGGTNQRGFSPSISLGFLRDVPINKNRTFAIGLGLGYSVNFINYNLQLDNRNNGIIYSLMKEDEYNKNRLTTHYIDLPIEIRWRTSTPESHKFWRIYTGLKASYLIANRFNYEQFDVKIKETKSVDLNKIQYGAYLSVGWNSWNSYIYYGLNPIFKSAVLNNHPIKMSSFNVGLQFYVL